MSLKLLKAAWHGIKYLRKSTSAEALLLKRLEAQNFVKSIPDETWNKISKSIFAQPGESKSKFLEHLGDFKKYCLEQKIELSPEVQKAYQTLEHKATVMADRLNEAVARGKAPKNVSEYGKKFRKNNEQAINIIENQLENMQNKISTTSDDWLEQSNRIYRLSSHILDDFFSGENFYNSKICELSKNVLSDGQIFYHGTKHQRSIAKNGFHLIPKKLQAFLGSREMGQGIYLTPDKNVAAFYAGLRGGILPCKVKLDKVAVVNSDNHSKILSSFYNNIDDFLTNSSSTKLELMIKEIFKQNGYNAVYSREAVGGGIFMPARWVDDIIGAKQSQLCVFDVSDVKILDKSFKERALNEALQVKSCTKRPLNVYKAVKNRIAEFNQS